MTAKPQSKPKPKPKSKTQRRPRTAQAAPKKKTARSAPQPVAEAAPPVVAAAEPDLPIPGEAFTPPEINFSARVPQVPPDRPWPTHRRAVFIDVENTSRPGRITEAFEALRIDRANTTTDIVASGNWRVIGNETARLLAGRGAQLVHSAPKTGVRDWSDLRIAVGAGVWLASARPGDRLDIVSDDKAFDAVGDVAATLGVDFHRHSFRRGAGDALTEVAPAAERAPRTRGGTGRRRGGRGRSASSRPASTVAAAPEVPPSIVESAPDEAAVTAQEVVEGAAPVDDLLRVVREQLTEAPGGVTLDMVANKLKQLGFQRPPNSPRLVTRLRAFRELSVSPRGLIRMADAEGPASEEPPADGAAAAMASDKNPRRRRRGGRGRRRNGAGAPPSSTPVS